MGLANRIASLFADKIFISFEDSLPYFPKNKTTYTSYPVREECFSKDILPVTLCGKRFDFQEPTLFITGGGNGSKILNEIVRNNLSVLKKNFSVIHQVGAGFEAEYQKLNDERYTAIGLITSGMIDLIKGSAVIISRSGAGLVAELLACQKKAILIPLPFAQNNEQFHNAKEAQRKTGSIILEEKDLNNQSFLNSIEALRKSPPLSNIPFKNGQKSIMDILTQETLAIRLIFCYPRGVSPSELLAQEPKNWKKIIAPLYGSK